jgi:hypothetical protein
MSPRSPGPADPPEGDLRCLGAGRVPIDGLVRNVQAAATPTLERPASGAVTRSRPLRTSSFTRVGSIGSGKRSDRKSGPLARTRR